MWSNIDVCYTVDHRRRNAVEDISERVHKRIQEAAGAKVFPVIV
jgi:ribosomal protein L13E